MHTDGPSSQGGTPRTAGVLAPALGAFDAGLRSLGVVPIEALDDSDLTELVRAMGAAEAQIAGVKARAVAAATRNGTSARSGAANPVSWLSEVSGGSRRAAHATSKLAAAIEAVPSLGQALQDGQIGSEQAQVVSLAVERGVLDDHARDALVRDAAGTSPEELRGYVRRREAMADQNQLRQSERDAKRRRFLRIRQEPDGSTSGEYRLPPVMGQLFREAVAALTTPDAANTPLELQRTGDQRRADALGMLAKLTLEAGNVGQVRAIKPHITIIAPIEMLSTELADAEAAGAVGVTPDGTVLSAAATRMLLCDAAVRRLVIDPAGQPLDIGRATRTWSGSQRAALAAVDGGCRGPHCDRPFAWTDIHHILWWSQDGETSIDNGVPACHDCHGLVHDRGWTVELEPSTRIASWTSPFGDKVVTHPRGPALALAEAEAETLDTQRSRPPVPGTAPPPTPSPPRPAIPEPPSRLFEAAISQPHLVSETRGPYNLGSHDPHPIRARSRPRPAQRCVPPPWTAALHEVRPNS
jgi:hypothetical protein